ncbi:MULTISPECIES: hypothetical protein [unclassified Nitratiruptor]|uniref:hypothetical protein n=1 Tax=unclassified Nitratiruptor TaxID=2624044 RepID=UPI00191507B6|nr:MULTISPECIES: hypothetical protein [unclassified Nitratiruptor]BCD59361.1 hypothetical protein NitYY0810_C0091 [Nitratiruptor sp. YY08-10]BCD63285.1 hypothetical protein NitYY0814_C0091 [Nitratiruptor sp. YY08-14]
MLHILKKIADWIVEHEKDEATDCTVPDEVIDEWLETIEERKKQIEEHGHTDSAQYEMLSDLEKKVKEIQAIRAKKCHIKS